MQTKIIQPLWYHPTNVMLIDDDVNLLESLVMKVNSNFPAVTFANPNHALEFLKKNTLSMEALSQQILSDIDPAEPKHLSTENVAIDFAPLHANLDKPDRFKKVVVAVVDRAMKEMDGLDFCRTVRQLGLPVKLILLTGHTGAREAVSAFNDHIIDAFVEKSADVAEMMNQVNPYIKKLGFQAFCDSSAQLLGLIANRLPLLTHNALADFLKKISQEYGIVEYYMIDASGSCLLITEKGAVKVLLVKSSSDFTNAYDIVDHKNSANTKVIEALKHRTAFPFTGIEENYFSFDSDQWKDTMVPMKKATDLDLYYSVVDVPKEVISFDHYVNKIWQPKAA